MDLCLRKKLYIQGEIDLTSKGGLVIAASKSAAKLYSGGDNFIHDIGENYNMSDILTKQDEIYGGDGKYQGLSGEGLGIQLELDKQTDERFFPSQLFYNLLSNNLVYMNMIPLTIHIS